MNTASRALLLWIALQPLAIAEGTQASEVFAKLAGHWQGTGEVRGMASTQQMTWEPVLEGNFLRLTFHNRMTGTDGKEWRFQAQAYYRIKDDGTVAGTWFDSRGMSFPLIGSVDANNVLTILWGTEDTERGRTSYQVSAEGLEVTDEVLTREGEWRTFGRTRLTRLP